MNIIYKDGKQVYRNIFLNSKVQKELMNKFRKKTNQ